MTAQLIQNLKRYEVDTPAPCGLVRAARSEIERLLEEIELMKEGVTGVYLKGHMDGVAKEQALHKNGPPQ